MRGRARCGSQLLHGLPVVTSAIMVRKDAGNKRLKGQTPTETNTKEKRHTRKGRRGKADDEEEWSEDGSAIHEFAGDLGQSARSRRCSSFEEEPAAEAEEATPNSLKGATREDRFAPLSRLRFGSGSPALKPGSPPLKPGSPPLKPGSPHLGPLRRTGSVALRLPDGAAARFLEFIADPVVLLAAQTTCTDFASVSCSAWAGICRQRVHVWHQW